MAEHLDYQLASPGGPQCQQLLCMVQLTLASLSPEVHKDLGTRAQLCMSLRLASLGGEL